MVAVRVILRLFRMFRFRISSESEWLSFLISTLKQGRGMIESVDEEVVIDSSEMISTDCHFFSRAGDDFDFIILFMFFVVFVS